MLKFLINTPVLSFLAAIPWLGTASQDAQGFSVQQLFQGGDTQQAQCGHSQLPGIQRNKHKRLARLTFQSWIHY